MLLAYQELDSYSIVHFPLAVEVSLANHNFGKLRYDTGTSSHIHRKS